MAGIDTTTRNRMTARIEGDFAVFITGMRINRFWRIDKWWPTFASMLPIIKSFQADPEIGLLDLHAWLSPRGPVMISYWRSIGHLEAFANNPDLPHTAAWRGFFQRVGRTRDVGVWHETYVIPAGNYEAVYTNIPFAFGLAAASEHVPVERLGHTAARRRASGAALAAGTFDESAPDLAADPGGPAVAA